MKKKPENISVLRTRMLRALAANRKVALNFPGVFMGIEGRQASRKHVAFGFKDGPWCRSADGEMNLPALGFLADTALGAASRLPVRSKYRVTTVHMKMQFTGEKPSGPVVAHASFLGHCVQTPLRQALSNATIMSGKNIIAHADGAFALIELPPGKTRNPLPWVQGAFKNQKPLRTDDLEEHEKLVLERFDNAQEAATTATPFIEHFWCGTPMAQHGGAQMKVAVTPHLGNRSGNVHGGILLGMAARTANTAVPAAMRLSNLSAWFISPGQGPELQVQSTIVQQGRSVAVVRTEITGSNGKRVFEATSQHIIKTSHTS